MLAAAASAAAVASGARAEGGVADELSVGAQLAFGPDAQPDGSVTGFAPLFKLAYQPARAPLWSTRLSWGLASIGSTDDAGAPVRAGNPWLEGSYGRAGASWAWRASAGATIPIAHVALSGEGRVQRSTYDHVMALSGFWDWWLWAPDRMAVPLGARASKTIDWWQYSVEVGVAGLVPMRAPETSMLWAAQGAAEVCLHSMIEWRACGRLQRVMPNLANGQSSQTAIGVRGELLPQSWRLFIAVLVNLGEPLGGGHGVQIWSLSFGKELRS